MHLNISGMSWSAFPADASKPWPGEHTVDVRCVLIEQESIAVGRLTSPFRSKLLKFKLVSFATDSRSAASGQYGVLVLWARK